MLRKAPMNYLAAAMIAAVLWLLSGLLLGNYLADNISLQDMTTDDFLLRYRITTGTASFVGCLMCCSWFASGAKPAAAADPVGYRKLWIGLMLGEVLLGALALIGLVVSMLPESLTLVNYLVILAGLVLGTALFFWLCTLAMSPRPVEAVVPGKR
ncbi:MAG: hypothetical protein WC700_04555 [Gemmatimonadaceae bacterium]|jgi:hypothetical protein